MPVPFDYYEHQDDSGWPACMYDGDPPDNEHSDDPYVCDVCGCALIQCEVEELEPEDDCLCCDCSPEELGDDKIERKAQYDMVPALAFRLDRQAEVSELGIVKPIVKLRHAKFGAGVLDVIGDHLATIIFSESGVRKFTFPPVESFLFDEGGNKVSWKRLMAMLDAFSTLTPFCHE